ncbi:chromosome partitioning protein ParA [Aureimonas flava]|uniref:Chromosome partitioning protein ParA n=1 Tax=Aureimonas flava TaxID=2320271 RepID=A0A3A1WEI7_9HYPH|nr:chromosome partitioning protein ParA [Aureimonas flava]RIX97584.1 chromosome partitioning protein ParA [Aureimonas flava]
MSSPLSFFFRRDGQRPSEGTVERTDFGKVIEPAPPRAPVAPPVTSHPGFVPPLDNIGQRNELLKVRIGEMAERLGDLRTLTDDFSQLIGPIETIAEELPRSKARILELEALLQQEMESGQALRREVDSLLGRYSTASSELSTAVARATRLENTMREQETAFDEQRLTLREKTTHANALERQLLAEVEQNQSLALEVKTLRAEAQVSDQALADAERMLGEVSERRQILEQENRRFQNLAGEQAAELVSSGTRIDELEAQGEAHLQTIALQETQIAAEQAGRQRAVAQLEAELSAMKTERSSASMKIEALSARLMATDQILAQVRGQLREREEAMRAAERANKEAIAERTTFDRRLEASKTEAGRLMAHLQDAQKGRTELEARADMLVKALAAKDAALEGVTTRANNLSDRVEALTLRFEQERQTLESANRRLIEELQNEKAERTLAQGALDIARENRSALQRQNETLKRATRSRGGESGFSVEGGAEGHGGTAPGGESSSNVRPFMMPEKGD